jgi:hypothetical protein
MSAVLSLSTVVSNSPFFGLALMLCLVILIALIIWVILLERKLSRLLGGKAENLEASLEKLHAHSKEMVTFRKDLEQYLETVETRLNKNIQSVETVRFNPFKGTGDGGNQSFATTLINEKGDGVVISSLYTRDRVSVYAKPVKKFVSEFELSEEEKESLVKASDALFRPLKGKK